MCIFLFFFSTVHSPNCNSSLAIHLLQWCKGWIFSLTCWLRSSSESTLLLAWLCDCLLRQSDTYSIENLYSLFTCTNSCELSKTCQFKQSVMRIVVKPHWSKGHTVQCHVCLHLKCLCSFPWGSKKEIHLRLYSEQMHEQDKNPHW